jgi:hypothetical protein
MAKLKAAPKTFAEAAAILKGRVSLKLGNNTWLELTGSDPVHDYIAVRLHNTQIVKFWADGSVTLHTGGWYRVTTKDRLNEFIRGRVQGKCETQSMERTNGITIRPMQRKHRGHQHRARPFKEGMDISKYSGNPPLHLKPQTAGDKYQAKLAATGDFRIQNEGSIFILYVQTDAAKQWVADNLPEDIQLWGTNGVVVEHRFILDIIDGIENSGLTVKR